MNGNPILFSRNFDLIYYFHKNQIYTFEIIEIYKDKTEIYKKDLPLSKIISFGNLERNFSITNSDNVSDKEINDNILFDLKIDWFTIEDAETIMQIKIFDINFNEKILQEEQKYFFVISNKLDGKNFRHFYKTEENLYSKKYFDSLQINTQEFCLNNLNKEVKIDFYILEENSEKALKFAYIEKKFRDLISNTNSIPIFSIDDLEKNNKIGECKLIISIRDFYQKELLELIRRHKLNINLSIAIDFTNSNGDPSKNTSLHYKEKGCLNPYKKAIKSIVNIVGEYDADQKFPVYGFGAKIKNELYVSHDFNINLNENDPNIYGISEILSNYENVFEHLTLFGPTILSFILERILTDLQRENLKIWDNKKQQNSLNYHILLILTDGEIDDIPETIDLIVKMSFYPISIIIVGIGDKDFSNMEKLGKFK